MDPSYSYSYSYPLAYPNEENRVPFKISTYSSLANALGTDTDYSMYLKGPPVSNPSYPYPARNVVNPGTYPARTPLTVSNGRCPSNPSVLLETWEPKNHPKLSSQYELLPQQVHVHRFNPHGYQSGVEFPAIYFHPKGDKDPYCLGDLLIMDTLPALIGGDEPVFIYTPDRYVKIKIMWPGYSRFPFEKRLNVRQDAHLTPTTLLMTLALYVDEFVRWIHNEGATVDPGQEHWEVKKVPEGVPAMWKNCVIGSLQHRSGSVWQPEIYFPRG